MKGKDAFGFEKLDVWRESAEYATVIYGMTKGFPADERFGLTSQLRRSAVSIAANLAEGSSRFTDKDFARFVEIAYGSLMENVSEAMIAQQQGFLAEDQLAQLRSRADKLARMLSGLRASLLNRQP